MSSLFLRYMLGALLALAIHAAGVGSAWAQTAPSDDVCVGSGVALGFFNGVSTTRAQADRALDLIRVEIGGATVNGDSIRYQLFYNYTNGWDDFVETFEQRLQEQGGLLAGRFELFFELLDGSTTWWQRMIDSVSALQSIRDGLVDAFRASVIRNLSLLSGNPPTEVNYIEHRALIDTWVIEGKKMVLLAHSQGNLFANAAYDYAARKTSLSSVKLVHVAPASPTLRGSHTLGDLDLVINGLRAFGTVAGNTDALPGYLLRAPGLDGKTDILGHGLLAIYLNPTLSTAARVKTHLANAFNEVVAPPRRASSGAFTVTLTWNGFGDADLHVVEPNGNRVYWRAKSGGSGYLDVDNTEGYGPEHYYASCSASILQTGTYVVQVANFDGADGKVATVQLSSNSEGVLITRQVTMGVATYSTPGYTLFSVVVIRDATTGKYLVAVGNN